MIPLRCQERSEVAALKVMTQETRDAIAAIEATDPATARARTTQGKPICTGTADKVCRKAATHVTATLLASTSLREMTSLVAIRKKIPNDVWFCNDCQEGSTLPISMENWCQICYGTARKVRSHIRYQNRTAQASFALCHHNARRVYIPPSSSDSCRMCVLEDTLG